MNKKQRTFRCHILEQELERLRERIHLDCEVKNRACASGKTEKEEREIIECMGVKPFLAVAPCVLIGVLASVMLCSSSGVSPQSAGWVPFIPDARQVRLDYWKPNATSCMNVSIEFASNGYDVSDWGTPLINGTNISADAQVLRWNGTSIPVITPRSYTYNLGNLSVAEYVFTFKAWGSPIKDTSFIVPEVSSLFLLLFMIATPLLVIARKRKHWGARMFSRQRQPMWE